MSTAINNLPTGLELPYDEATATLFLVEDLEGRGHVLGPWRPLSEELAGDTGLLVESWERRCACGTAALIGWTGDGHFALTADLPDAHVYCGEDGNGHALPANWTERISARCPQER